MQRTKVLETIDNIGTEVKLQGWVDTIRDHGKIVFIELRDFSGKVQIVGDQSLGKTGIEDIVEIIGTVSNRPENMVNPNMPTGKVEVQMKELKILGKSKELPFPIDTDGRDINEELRLKYRYLDLKRPRLQETIKKRSQFVQKCREFLFKQDFTEIETPLLTKSTAEGSRDFIVPSRLHPGKFFALPQSPQQYKQLLMIAGFERYFQIARCLRDEDLRADRGFEHTQIDIEMSFVTKEEVMKLDEEMITTVVEELGYKIKEKPFPRISYKDAIAKYGADKFDMRTEEEKKAGILAFAWVVDFPFFEKTEEGGWTFTHNPFSAPRDEDIPDLHEGKNIENIVTQQYDMVCNGEEVGGGSIRSHNPEVLKAVYKVMGYNDEQTKESVGHMIEAFTFGAPPHGGLAHGVDRMMMTLAAEEAMREVVAFPQSSSGVTAVTQAPTEVSDEQLKDLGIQVRSMKAPSTEKQDVFTTISNYLKSEGVEFKTYEHKPVFTSEEAAEVRGVSLESGAKALVLKTEKGPIMAVVSGVNKLDLNALKKTYGLKDVSMADRDMLKQVTGLEPGAVPPFGSLFKIPTYVDKNLAQLESINFNAGSNTKSIGMKTEDYLKIEKPIVGEFSK